MSTMKIIELKFFIGSLIALSLFSTSFLRNLTKKLIFSCEKYFVIKSYNCSGKWQVAVGQLPTELNSNFGQNFEPT